MESFCLEAAVGRSHPEGREPRSGTSKGTGQDVSQLISGRTKIGPRTLLCGVVAVLSPGSAVTGSRDEGAQRDPSSEIPPGLTRPQATCHYSGLLESPWGSFSDVLMSGTSPQPK